MPYDFGSDIVVDAIRASGNNPVGSARHTLNLDRTAPTTASAAVQVSKDLPSFRIDRSTVDKSTKQGVENEETFRRFEAAVISTFVQAMLPKDATGVFGEGFAGDMWRSQMAEKIADQLAERSGLGISELIAKSFQNKGTQAEPVAEASDSVGISPKSQFQLEPAVKASGLIHAIQLEKFIDQRTEGSGSQVDAVRKGASTT